MNYQRIYNRIIDYRKINPFKEGYTEKHHIIPRSLGGGDEKENIVKLSGKEHFICHLLLTKIYKENELAYYKMVSAFYLMLTCGPRRYNSGASYARLRERQAQIMSERQRGSGNSGYGIKWITNTVSGEIRKIKREDVIPEGFIKGKRTSVKLCNICNASFRRLRSSSTDYCSLNCANEARQVAISKRVVKKKFKKLQNVVTGEIFNSLQDCALFYKKTEETIRLWLNAGKFTVLSFTYK